MEMIVLYPSVSGSPLRHNGQTPLSRARQNHATCTTGKPTLEYVRQLLSGVARRKAGKRVDLGRKTGHRWRTEIGGPAASRRREETSVRPGNPIRHPTGI